MVLWRCYSYMFLHLSECSFWPVKRIGPWWLPINASNKSSTTYFLCWYGLSSMPFCKCIPKCLSEFRSSKKFQALKLKNNFLWCRILLGLRPNWKNEYLELFEETWTYSDALAAKSYEGFFETGPQLTLITCLQLHASWPSMQPLILDGMLTKAYYFSSQKPGNPYLIYLFGKVLLALS